MKNQPHLNTLCVHSGRIPDPGTGAIAPPIYLTTTFERDADGSYPRGYRYSGEVTPNRHTLESCLAALEQGVGALVFPSGLAANMALLELLDPGDRLVAPSDVYYGAREQFLQHAARHGAQVDLVDFSDSAALEGALVAPTRMVWVETPANPLLSITDLRNVSDKAHAAGALVICDNTVATPVCQQPFKFGVDVIVHSATKYLGGHSDILGGAIIIRDDMALLMRLRTWQQMTGSTLGAFDCWLLMRSISTLPLRVKSQCAGALKIAEFLSNHPRVERVLYPGLRNHDGHAIARGQMPGGFGAVISVCLHGGEVRAMQAAARTRIFTRATSLGGVESLIEHRASIEGHGTLAPYNLLRLSIGIEDPDDLIEDLTQSLT